MDSNIEKKSVIDAIISENLIPLKFFSVSLKILYFVILFLEIL